MKSSRPRFQHLAVALFSIAAPLSTGIAQTTATTVPVGFITVTVPAATSPTTPSNKVVSIPLYNAAAFASAVGQVTSADSFTMTGATWSAGQFTAVPHLVRVKSGTNTGRYFLITGHTANALTVDTRGVDLTQVLAANDKCEILPANTLGSLFGTTTPIVQTGVTANQADQALIWNGRTWDTFYHNGTEWRQSAGVGSKNGVVVFPDEGILFTRRATTPLSITMMGTVPSTTERSDLDPGSTFVANRFPVEVKLVDTGLHLTAGWVSGPTAAQSDKLFVMGAAGWETYFYNGTNWVKDGTVGNQNDTVVPTGGALFVKRSSPTPSVLVQQLPYTP